MKLCEGFTCTKRSASNGVISDVGGHARFAGEESVNFAEERTAASEGQHGADLAGSEDGTRAYFGDGYC